MIRSTEAPALRLVRAPGELGPILRCFGELTVANAESLRRELALLASLGHPVLTLNLSGCRSVERGALVPALHAARRQSRCGSRLALVAQPDQAAQLLGSAEIDRLLPVFATEQATAALQSATQPEPASAGFGPRTREAAGIHLIPALTGVSAPMEGLL